MAPRGLCRVPGHHVPCHRCHGAAGESLQGVNRGNDETQEVRDVVLAEQQMAPDITTCTQMAQTRTSQDVVWQVSFPPLPNCAHHRKRRSWYDTLLGGSGTLLGLSNTIDGEVTRTMLSNTGQHASEAVYQMEVWMPTTVTTQKETAALFQEALRWELKTWKAMADILRNVSEALNWTTCTLQVLNIGLQKERFQRMVTTNNINGWRTMWNITKDLWFLPQADRTVCNDSMCSGHWKQFNVSKVTTVCRYFVLPVITSTGFWFLKIQDDWFDPQTNLIYDLSRCETADKGMVCKLQQGHVNPCLTKDTVLCDWTHEPSRDMLWQIGPHSLCVATTKSHSQLPTVPFTGCLHNVYMWHWGNQTYKLTNYTTGTRLTAVQWQVLQVPWSVSLDRFKCALNDSKILQDLINSHQSNVSSLKVSTLLTAGKVLHAAKLIEQSSAHHWWDIFSGMSPTAKQYVVPPLMLLMMCIAFLTLCNVFTCLYVRRVKREISQRIYNTALR
uniref:Uncharacterized protein n=1 Tax=Kryptolebias marmoratus TaxID=37003 RepID=A0A3Q3A8X2_KRYMA